MVGNERNGRQFHRWIDKRLDFQVIHVCSLLLTWSSLSLLVMLICCCCKCPLRQNSAKSEQFFRHLNSQKLSTTTMLHWRPARTAMFDFSCDQLPLHCRWSQQPLNRQRVSRQSICSSPTRRFVFLTVYISDHLCGCGALSCVHIHRSLASNCQSLN